MQFRSLQTQARTRDGSEGGVVVDFKEWKRTDNLTTGFVFSTKEWTTQVQTEAVLDLRHCSDIQDWAKLQDATVTFLHSSEWSRQDVSVDYRPTVSGHYAHECAQCWLRVASTKIWARIIRWTRTGQPSQQERLLFLVETGHTALPAQPRYDRRRIRLLSVVSWYGGEGRSITIVQPCHAARLSDCQPFRFFPAVAPLPPLRSVLLSLPRSGFRPCSTLIPSFPLTTAILFFPPSVLVTSPLAFCLSLSQYSSLRRISEFSAMSAPVMVRHNATRRGLKRKNVQITTRTRTAV